MVFLESRRKSFNSGEVYCISGIRDMVLDFGTVSKNSGRLESLNSSYHFRLSLGWPATFSENHHTFRKCNYSIRPGEQKTRKAK